MLREVLDAINVARPERDGGFEHISAMLGYQAGHEGVLSVLVVPATATPSKW